nr:organic solute transporter alpha-like protein [Leptinotarsa decemlineata]
MSPTSGVNATECPPYYIPTTQQYLSETDVYGITLITAGTVPVLVVLALFVDTLFYIMKNASPRVKTHSAFVIGVYPVVSLVTYLAILVPRAHLLAEAITQGMFMSGMYQLFCLFVAYCGGEANLVEKVKPNTLRLQAPPCCCWPCCFFLPDCRVTKSTLRSLRLLVLQLPVVQGLVYLILLVMWAERESLYQVNYLYLQPIVFLSIVLGIWSMSMLIRLLKANLDQEYLLFGKFLVLQLVLVFAKLQGLIFRVLVSNGIFPCRSPITPQVYANLIHNTLMLSEMILLGALARRLYKRQLPDIDTDVISISTIGRMMEKGNINNNDNISSNLNSKLSKCGIDNTGAEIDL